MADRRSLSDAMTLNPVQNAFIHGDQVAMHKGREPNQLDPEEGLEVRSSSPQSMASVSQPPGRRRGRPPHITRESTEVRPESPISTHGMDFAPILVSLTTRLSPATAEALRRATLEQKLRRRWPHTQQEIVESAVRHWLKTHEFLKAS